jgi:hypothetical protein
MCRILLLSLSVGLVLGLTRPALAQDAPEAVIDKAIKAFGGPEKLDKLKAVQTKSKGTVVVMGQDLAFTEASIGQEGGKIKSVVDTTFMGMKINQTIVFNGKEGWINFNGNTIDMPEQMLETMKETTYLSRLGRLTVLKDKAMFTLAPLGEIKVNNRPAVGVKVSSKGHKDVNFYFDKENGLLAKIEHRTVDFMTNQEVAEERIITEYQEVDGVKMPKKALINRDGKKYVEAEVLEVKFVDKFADSEFAKP